MLSEIWSQIQASEAISSTSMRNISDNIQFSRMNKAIIFPQASSQLYSYGFNETVSDSPLETDSKFKNTYDSNIYMDLSPHNQQGVFPICSQSPNINHQSGPSSLMTIKRLDYPSYGANHLITKATTMPNYDNNAKHQQVSHVKRIPGQSNEIGIITGARKRSIEDIDITTKRSNEIVAGNKPSDQSEWSTNKKMAICFQEKLQEPQAPKEIKDVQKERVPMRKTQKLADKITALQKLVSPYGKTDTASVLHEASVFIKVLQDQIENTFQSLTSNSLNNEYHQSKANAASGIAVNDECKLKFLELKAKRTYRFIIYKIEEKQVVVEKLGEPTNSYEDFAANLPADECRYAVYDFDFMTEENVPKSRIFFIAWSPDTSKVRSKMIYASSKDRFKRELDGIQIELQATDPTEIGLDVIKGRAGKAA
ncbi:hypothetical protein ACH5RR_016621 [Cinchona calisaya]|uniref:Uncharacterized protein n=1 Tax=Cinchona calisaya TaxID=153742 RepID=A0ABD3A051_9GENT